MKQKKDKVFSLVFFLFLCNKGNIFVFFYEKKKENEFFRKKIKYDKNETNELYKIYLCLEERSNKATIQIVTLSATKPLIAILTSFADNPSSNLSMSFV